MTLAVFFDMNSIHPSLYCRFFDPPDLTRNLREDDSTQTSNTINFMIITFFNEKNASDFAKLVQHVTDFLWFHVRWNMRHVNDAGIVFSFVVFFQFL